MAMTSMSLLRALGFAGFIAHTAAQSSTLCRTVTTTGPCTPPTPSSTTSTCPNPPPRPSPTSCVAGLHIIISRATLECMGFGTSYCVANAIMEKQPDWNVEVDYNPYPATVSGPIIAEPSSYVKSETEGAEDLTDMIEQQSNRCPRTPIALIGYSQGAQATADALWGNSERHWPFDFNTSNPLPSNYSESIAAVVLFGDPSFMPDMKEINYGTYESYGSWFPRRDISAAAPYYNRTRSYCDANDAFCDCNAFLYTAKYNNCVRNSTDLATHTGYLYCNVYTQDAAQFIIDKTESFLGVSNRKEDLK